MSEITVEATITLTLGDQTIELTDDLAKELWRQLDERYGKKEPVLPYVPPLPLPAPEKISPLHPWKPWKRPFYYDPPYCYIGTPTDFT